MLAIITPNPDTPAETFVRQHIRLISPKKTVVVYFEGDGLSVKNIPSLKINRNFKKFSFEKLYNLIFWGYSGVIDKKNELNIINFFCEHKVSSVFAEFGPTGCLISKICKKLNLKLVVNFHGHDATVMGKRYLIRRAYRFLNSNVNTVVCGSMHFKKIVASVGISFEKIKVVPCGIELESFKNDQKKNSNLIIGVGRFVEKKAPHLSIKAFDIVQKKIPEAKLELIGGGKLYDNCKELIKNLYLEEKITLHGVKTHKFVKERLSVASIFVQHSITAKNGDTESQGVSLLEAMASKLPVVTTDHNGFKETVANETTGYLVEENDYKEMAKKIIYLLLNKNKLKTMGENGYRYAKSNYESRKIAKRLNKIIFEEG